MSEALLFTRRISYRLVLPLLLHLPVPVPVPGDLLRVSVNALLRRLTPHLLLLELDDDDDDLLSLNNKDVVANRFSGVANMTARFSAADIILWLQ